MEKRNFDKDALSWDEFPTRVSLAKDVAETILKQIALKQDMDVLDFGCGTGLVTLLLCSYVHSVFGVDSSKGMLDVLTAKIQKQKVKNVRTGLLDLTAGDVLTGGYHLIVSSMTIHHVENLRELLRQFNKVLKPGGQIAIADLDEEGGRFHDNNDGVFHFGFSREKLEKLFREEGFVDIRHTTAACVNKPGPDGVPKAFTVFLITGQK